VTAVASGCGPVVNPRSGWRLRARPRQAPVHLTAILEFFQSSSILFVFLGCALCRYPKDRVPPHTSSKSRQGAGRVSTRCHASCSSGPRLPVEVGFGAATCLAAPSPAAQPGAAPGPPRVLWLQLPLPSPGQLRGHHVSCGSSSHCPARGSSGAATCPAAPARAAQPGAALGPPSVLRPQLPLPSPGQLRGHHVCPGGPMVGELLK
jgi:hypothetical protein